MALIDKPRAGLFGLFLVLCAGFPAVSSGLHTAIPTPLLKLDPADLPAANWAQTLNKTIGSGLCQEGTHWRTCYDINAGECAELMNTLTRGCTLKMLDSLPVTLTPTVATLAGQQVGFCVGELFYQLAQPKLKADAQCQRKNPTP